ncbi:MAG TPA: MarR family transcriptional regulator [Clostridiales bacterium]|nr:MarR family transcriptional regulator [Clostridiales bacterium]
MEKKSISRMITVLYRKTQSTLSAVLRKYDLTTAEQPFFVELQRNDGVTQEELSSVLYIDKAATTRAIKSLEKKGYVKCFQDEQDRRKIRVFATDKARECGFSVKNDLSQFNELLTQHIDAESQEIIYNALLQMEQNAIHLAKEKEKVPNCEEITDGSTE